VATTLGSILQTYIYTKPKDKSCIQVPLCAMAHIITVAVHILWKILPLIALSG